MRHKPKDIVEKGRVNDGVFSSVCGQKYGAFFLTCPKTGERLKIIVGDGSDWSECGLPGEPWEHVSVSCERRCPVWDEMCWVRDLFFSEDETVIQYHPAYANYVNIHSFVLHMWRPTKTVIPMPPMDCV